MVHCWRNCYRSIIMNNKVYLAKSNLATGLDVEYVKSNLLRIPDIQVIEYTTGIKPSDCSCMVIVNGDSDNFVYNEEDPIFINKTICNALNDFLETGELIYVYIYSGKGEATNSNDVESTIPTAYYLENYDEMQNSFDEYGVIGVDYCQCDFNLLEYVDDDINEFGLGEWMKVPRHKQPEAKYAIPPIPSPEMRKSPTLVKQQASNTGWDKSILSAGKKRRLLLRSRKR